MKLFSQRSKMRRSEKAYRTYGKLPNKTAHALWKTQKEKIKKKGQKVN